MRLITNNQQMDEGEFGPPLILERAKAFSLIWQTLAGNTSKKIQARFMKITAQQIRFDLVVNNPLVLHKLRLNAKDRVY